MNLLQMYNYQDLIIPNFNRVINPDDKRFLITLNQLEGKERFSIIVFDRDSQGGEVFNCSVGKNRVYKRYMDTLHHYRIGGIRESTTINIENYKQDENRDREDSRNISFKEG